MAALQLDCKFCKQSFPSSIRSSNKASDAAIRKLNENANCFILCNTCATSLKDAATAISTMKAEMQDMRKEIDELKGKLSSASVAPPPPKLDQSDFVKFRSIIPEIVVNTCSEYFERQKKADQLVLVGVPELPLKLTNTDDEEEVEIKTEADFCKAVCDFIEVDSSLISDSFRHGTKGDRARIIKVKFSDFKARSTFKRGYYNFAKKHTPLNKSFCRNDMTKNERDIELSLRGEAKRLNDVAGSRKYVVRDCRLFDLSRKRFVDDNNLSAANANDITSSAYDFTANHVPPLYSQVLTPRLPSFGMPPVFPGMSMPQFVNPGGYNVPYNMNAAMSNRVSQSLDMSATGTDNNY